VDGITHAKNTASCTDLMVASNVFGRGFGKKKIELIVETFPAIRQGDPPADVKAMSQVDGIGSVTARAFLDALPKFYAFMDDIGMKCKTRPVAALSPQQPPLNVDFTKQVVVFTGFRNKEWAATIAAAGGVYNDSVTKSTTLVVATNVDEINTKLEKARKLGIPIISTSEFEQKYLFIQ
jgi:DNA ligase (NAD+)